MSDDKRREARSALGGKGALREQRVVHLPLDGLVVEERGEGDNGESWRFRGLASRTGVKYTVFDYYGSFTESVNAGAFRTTLAENPQVVFLIQHGGLPLASTHSGTMRLWESERGLEVEADLDLADPMAQHVVSGVRRGSIDSMSFGFRVTKDHWDDEMYDRTITAVNLHRGDVSVVSYGANPEAVTTEEDPDGGESSDPIDDGHRVALLVQQQREEELLFDLAAW